jgi:lysophospholipase L1-like esterase
MYTAFIGDSIVARFLQEGKSTWEKNYAGSNTGNFGTIGDSTQMLVEKLERDELPLQETQAIVLMIGSTDLRHKIKVNVVYDQIRKIVMLLQGGARPGVKILILGILPRGDVNADCNHAIHETNELISQIENGFTVRFLDLEAKFMDKETGKIKQELFASDRINLSTEGYELLAQIIATVFQEIQMP